MNWSNFAKWLGGVATLLSVAGCATNGKTRPDFCGEYPDKPPVATRDGQDIQTDKEIINLIIYWEVWCNES